MKNRTAQPRPWAIAPQIMRQHERVAQKRDYREYVAFECLSACTRPSRGQAPVALLQKENGTLQPVFVRDLKRMVRLATADAKREHLLHSGNGPASAFLKFAQRPYERLMQQTHPKPTL